MFTQFEYHIKAVFRGKVRALGFLLFCCVCLMHDKRAIVLAVAPSLPELLCGSQHSPQQLRDTLPSVDAKVTEGTN